MDFKLRFPEVQIQHWADRYPDQEDHVVEFDVAPEARKRGFLTKEELHLLCKWKSPRPERKSGACPTGR